MNIDNLKRILTAKGKDKSEIKTLEDLNLSNHAYRTLLRNNITTLDELKDIGLEGIQGLRSVGTSTYNEIQDKAGFLWREEQS